MVLWFLVSFALACLRIAAGVLLSMPLVYYASWAGRGAVHVLTPHAARPDLPLRRTGSPCGGCDLLTVAVVRVPIAHSDGALPKKPCDQP
jgi:hypothetical protein